MFTAAVYSCSSSLSLYFTPGFTLLCELLAMHPGHALGVTWTKAVSVADIWTSFSGNISLYSYLNQTEPDWPNPYCTMWLYRPKCISRTDLKQNYKCSGLAPGSTFPVKAPFLSLLVKHCWLWPFVCHHFSDSRSFPASFLGSISASAAPPQCVSHLTAV